MLRLKRIVVVIFCACAVASGATSKIYGQPPELELYQRLVGLKWPPESLSFMSSLDGGLECVTNDNSTGLIFDCRTGTVSQRISFGAPGATARERDDLERMSYIGAEANSKLLVGGYAGTLALFEGNTQGNLRLVSTWKPYEDAGIQEVCALAKESTWLVHLDDGAVQIIDSSTRQTIRKWDTEEGIGDICTDGTGKVFAFSDREINSSRVRIYHGVDWKETEELDVAIEKNELSPNPIRRICLSRDGKNLYCVYDDRRIAKFSRSLGKITAVFDNRRSGDEMERWIPCFSMATSPKDTYLATGSYSGFGLIFSTEDLRQVALCKQEVKWASTTRHVVWSRDGKYLATSDSVTPIINVWKTGKFSE